MSKRHQSSRRRTYGRRQHEIHERQDRRIDRGRPEVGWAQGDDAQQADPLSFMDPRAPRLRFDFAD